MFKSFITTKQEVSKNTTLTRQYKMDLSRLELTALDNNKNMREQISIFLLGFEPKDKDY